MLRTIRNTKLAMYPVWYISDHNAGKWLVFSQGYTYVILLVVDLPAINLIHLAVLASMRLRNLFMAIFTKHLQFVGMHQQDAEYFIDQKIPIDALNMMYFDSDFFPFRPWLFLIAFFTSIGFSFAHSGALSAS
jgi:hypothetical protein